ncbi:hypothetical protein EJB05_52248, partial [Eragrostis curvula]
MDGRGRRNRVRVHCEQEDHISNLPDDLLLSILTKLRSTPAAARTSVLSRRWRCVWTALPELLLLDVSAADSVDAALDACSVPTVSRLVIAASPPRSEILDAARVALWLRFASQRLTGELSLHLPRINDEDGEELVLPPCERVTAIKFHYRFTNTLRLPSHGSFPGLTEVVIMGAVRMEAGDLETFGSARCPCLRTLNLCGVILATVSDFSIRSDTLERLSFFVRNARKVEAITPSLRYLRGIGFVPSGAANDLVEPGQAYIVAPKLAELEWYGSYDPRDHQFVESGRHLRKLFILQPQMVELMRRFDIVDHLVLSLRIPTGIQGYKRFLQLITCKFAKCDTMGVHMNARRHAFAPSLLYLLRKSPGLRKLVVELPRPVTMELGINGDPCTSDCPCSSPESYMMDNFTLGSLEEVVMMDFRGLPNHVEALIMLLGCNAPALKNVVVNMPADVPSISGETFQKINSFARPNIDVKFNVLSP